VIAYALGSVGVLGTAALAYYITPAARGAHRYVVPRSELRAEIVRLERKADALVCTVTRAAIAAHVARADREEAWAMLGQAEGLVADLEKKAADRDHLLAETIRLQAELDNARAMRQLSAGPLPPDDASALPDDVQEFVTTTATAWRARA
jgi:hypothetical protein